MSSREWDIVGFGVASGAISGGAAVTFVEGQAITAAALFLVSVLAWTMLVNVVWRSA